MSAHRTQGDSQRLIEQNSDSISIRENMHTAAATLELQIQSSMDQFPDTHQKKNSHQHPGP